MTQIRVALVCPDDSLRMAAAQAFDSAPAEWDVSLHRTVPEATDVVVSVGCELPGALAFDLANPSDIVTDVQRRVTASDRRLITVVGASGGCGATTISLHLAAEAARRRSLLATRSPWVLSDRLGVEGHDEVATPVPVPGGFKAVGVVGTDPTSLLAGLIGDFERVVVDGDPAALAGIVAVSDACVMVIAPTLPSAHAASRLLESLPEARWAVVANRVGPGGETTRAELQRILGRRIGLELPCSRALRDAEGERRLTASWSLWWRRLHGLADALGLT